MKQTHVWTLRALRYPVYLMARNQYFFTGLLEQVYLCTICLLASNVITARKRSLGQGYIFTGICHSVNRGVCLSACWDTPLQGDPTPGRLPLQGDPLPSRETPLQGDPPPGPHPGGKLRGDQIQAHTQGGN